MILCVQYAIIYKFLFHLVAALYHLVIIYFGKERCVTFIGDRPMALNAV